MEVTQYEAFSLPDGGQAASRASRCVFVGSSRVNERAPAETSIEVDRCQSRLLAVIAFTGQDTSVCVDSKVLTGVEEINVILGHSRVGDTGGKGNH